MEREHYLEGYSDKDGLELEANTISQEGLWADLGLWKFLHSM